MNLLLKWRKLGSCLKAEAEFFFLSAVTYVSLCFLLGLGDRNQTHLPGAASVQEHCGRLWLMLTIIPSLLLSEI